MLSVLKLALCLRWLLDLQLLYLHSTQAVKGKIKGHISLSSSLIQLAYFKCYLKTSAFMSLTEVRLKMWALASSKSIQKKIRSRLVERGGWYCVRSYQSLIQRSEKKLDSVLVWIHPKTGPETSLFERWSWEVKELENENTVARSSK